MLYTSLSSFYETVHVMHTYMNYTYEDINNMYPYEREVLLLMFKRDKEKEQKAIEEQRKRYHNHVKL